MALPKVLSSLVGGSFTPSSSATQSGASSSGNVYNVGGGFPFGAPATQNIGMIAMVGFIAYLVLKRK